jgi:hypothetical protein
MNTDVTLKHGFSLSTNIREKLCTLEVGMKQGIQDGSLTEQEVPLEEFHGGGVYARQIFIKAGTALVGAIHKDEWLHVVSRGKIRIVTEAGTRIIDATEQPQTFTSPAGVKRAGFVLEDTWWTSFLATELKTDVEVRAKHIVSDYAELDRLEASE